MCGRCLVGSGWRARGWVAIDVGRGSVGRRFREGREGSAGKRGGRVRSAEFGMRSVGGGVGGAEFVGVETFICFGPRRRRGTNFGLFRWVVACFACLTHPTVVEAGLDGGG